MRDRGFLLAEILIACAFFVLTISTLSLFVFQSISFLAWSDMRVEAYVIAKHQLAAATSTSSFIQGDFTVSTRSIPIDNFTEEIEVEVSYLFSGRHTSILLHRMAVDTSESEGQSSCRPIQEREVWKHPKIYSFDLGIFGKDIKPTDVDVVGPYAYIASNSATASSPDFVVLDISKSPEVSLVSSLDTGPGWQSLHVAGYYAYGANTSINSQLQVINLSDRRNPRLAASFKIPGEYGSSTPTGSAVFYMSGKVFLGTDKSDIGELHLVDVTDPSVPRHITAQEVGHGINDFFAFKDTVYVASPHRDELLVFLVSPGGFMLRSSYSDPGATGGGKRLSLFLGKLFLGKTKTIGREELIVLDVSASSSVSALSRLALPASVHGIIAYGDLVFTLINRVTDSFYVFDTENTRINVEDIDFPGAPLNFDCDESLFVVVSNESSVITFINPSRTP